MKMKVPRYNKVSIKCFQVTSISRDHMFELWSWYICVQSAYSGRGDRADPSVWPEVEGPLTVRISIYGLWSSNMWLQMPTSCLSSLGKFMYSNPSCSLFYPYLQVMSCDHIRSEVACIWTILDPEYSGIWWWYYVFFFSILWDLHVDRWYIY